MSLNGAPVNKASWTLTREAILLLRPAASKLGLRTRLRIALLGCVGRRRGCRGGSKSKLSYTRCSEIPVVIGSRRRNRTAVTSANNRQRVLTTVQRASAAAPPQHTGTASTTPTLYVLNAAALSKPGAVEHLAADLKSSGASVAVITETHFKQKHADSVIGIDGYTVFRRDRTGRRGGGVALYVQSDIQSSVWSPSSVSVDDCAFELLWVRVGVGLFIAALYHPPRPVYVCYRRPTLPCRALCCRTYSRLSACGNHISWRPQQAARRRHCRTHGSHTDRPSAYPRCQPTRPCI